MSTTVHVKGIDGQTSEKEVRDFFSFCGKIQSLSVTPTSDAAGSSKTATVTFEKETAAKTALLLDNTQLGTSQVEVSSAASLGDLAGGKSADDDDDVPAEEKPRTRILAEYLAHGYMISDKAIQQAIDLDQKHGISSRFQKSLSDFDAKYKVSDKTKAADSTYKVSERAGQAWSGLYSYFDKALDTPTGQRLRTFYSQGNKQVLDVHNEARHLADLKAGKFTPHKTAADGARTECRCSADAGKCGCAPGTCACSSCAKNPDTPHKGAEEMGLEKVGGTERTKCNCHADAGTCACEPGKCSCSSCAKNPEAEKPTLPLTAPASKA